MGDSIIKVDGAIKIGCFAEDPESPENGTIYYNTQTNQIKIYSNGTWLIWNVTV